jgi:hypothetical protein
MRVGRLALVCLLGIAEGVSIERREDINAIAQALQAAGLVQQLCSADVSVSGDGSAGVNVNVQASQSVTIPGLSGSYSSTVIQQGNEKIILLLSL